MNELLRRSLLLCLIVTTADCGASKPDWPAALMQSLVVDTLVTGNSGALLASDDTSLQLARRLGLHVQEQDTRSVRIACPGSGTANKANVQAGWAIRLRLNFAPDSEHATVWAGIGCSRDRFDGTNGAAGWNSWGRWELQRNGRVWVIARQLERFVSQAHANR